MQDQKAKHHHWSAEKVLSRLRRLSDLSAKKNQRDHADLYGAAIRYFGSWKIAVERAGFNYSEIVKRKSPGQWSQERIIEKIGNLREKNSNSVRQAHCDLYSAAIRQFGSWKSAIEAAGFKYQDIRRDWVPVDGSSFRLKRKP
jgi:hypothetical protein